MFRSYLNLGEILSQLWVNQWTLLFILIALKLYLFKISLIKGLDEASYKIGLICSEVTEYSSRISTLPTALSSLANEMVAISLSELYKERVHICILLIDIVEYMIIFFIEIFYGTFTCLLTAVMSGTVDLALDSTTSVLTSVNSTIVDLTGEIQSSLSGLSATINALMSVYEKVKLYFTGTRISGSDSDQYLNHINLTISSLQNIHIPGTVTDSINRVKSEVPTFSTNSTTAFIEREFDSIKLKISQLDSGNITSPEMLTMFNQNLQFQAPSQQFEKSIQKFANTLNKCSNWILITLLVLAMLGILPVVFVEWRKWINLNRLSRELHECQQLKDDDYFIGVMITLNNYKHHLLFSFFSCINLSPSLQWLFSYIFSGRATIILLLGLGAFISVAAQYLLLHILSLEVEHLKHNFPNTVMPDIDTEIKAMASNWTNRMNDLLAMEEKNLNNELFGWVQKTSSSLNGTVNSVLTDLSAGLSIFNNTFFYAPMQTVVYCTVGRKLERIQSGINFVHKAAEISLPRVNETLILSNMNTFWNRSADPSTMNSLSLKSEIGTALDSVTSGYEKSLKIELYIASGILVLWAILVITGVLIMCIRNGVFPNRESEKVSQHFDFSAKGEKCNQNIILHPNIKDISSPRPLTNEEKKAYGYPHIDPYKKYDCNGNDYNEAALSSSSLYSHGSTLRMPLDSSENSQY